MPSRILQASLEKHSEFEPLDLTAFRSLTWEFRNFRPNEEIARHGERPKGCVIVMKGMVGRFQNLPDGRRQFISFHSTGDMPDAQSLFLEEMDHSVCAVGPATVAMIDQKQLLRLFEMRPAIGFAIWRETLIDAAIFREAVVNNSARAPLARMAHLFCELSYRQRAAGSADEGSFYFPLTQTQLGDALGMSLVTTNRTLQKLRQQKLVDLEDTRVTVVDWGRLVEAGEFDPRYLHFKCPPNSLSGNPSG